MTQPFNFTAELSDPSPQSWHKCAKELDKLWLSGGSVLGARALNHAVSACQIAINTWPTAARKAVPRDPLKHWRRSTSRDEPGHDALLDLCLKVKEVHTYEYFITEVCNHPDLLFPDGTQQCHLARGFTGAARSMKSDAWLNIGERGQGDLPGWLSVDLVPYGRVAVKQEVEIKSLTGTLSKAQRARRDELTRAGALYISAKSVSSVVGQLVAAREALRWAGIPAGFKGGVVFQRGTGNMRAAQQAIEQWRAEHSW
jgi:hypothetical protein